MNSHVNDLVTSSLAPSHSHNDDRDFGFEPHERGISNTYCVHLLFWFVNLWYIPQKLYYKNYCLICIRKFEHLAIYGPTSKNKFH